VRPHRVGQADAQRLGSVDRVAGHAQLLGLRHADPAGQALRAAEPGDDAELDLGLTELGAVRRMDEVTGQRELAAAAEGEAVDRGDPRLLRALDRLRERAAHLGERLALARRELAHLGDIGAGDERLVARAGQDHRADLARDLELAARGGELADHLRRQRVERGLARHGDDRERPVDDDLEGLECFVAHGCSVHSFLAPCGSYS
jgi:hypothetical protein